MQNLPDKMKVLGLILAGGQSKRFGKDNKLLHPLDGKPLIKHIADRLASLDLSARAAVVSSPDVAKELPEYDILWTEKEIPLQSESLSIGLRHAMRSTYTHVLVVLGDMPFVSKSTLLGVIKKGSGDTPAAATNGRRTMPPALFPRACIAEILSAGTNPETAKEMLRSLPKSQLVFSSDGELFDIDTKADLNRLP